MARHAAQRGEAVVALGGDGLIGRIVGTLRQCTEPLLGVLPGGRGNDFARALGLGQDPVAACRVLCDGAPRALDIGEVDGRSFVGIASVGFDSEANRAANAAPRWMGRQVYSYGALRALLAWQHARFILESGGACREVWGWTVAVANSKAYGGGMFVAPEAQLDDGLLDMVTLAACSKRRFLTGLLPKVFRGSHVGEPEVSAQRVTDVRISADRALTVYADGDPIGELPVTVRVVPRAIDVLCPTA